MSNKYEYCDLLHFGFIYQEDSKFKQDKFIVEIKHYFPSVMLQDLYDEIKGYRQEVYIAMEEKDRFIAWITAFNYLELGFLYDILIKDENKHILNHYIKKAKEYYPEKFNKVAYAKKY